MLRNVLLAVALLAFATGIVLVVSGAQGFAVALWGAVLAVLILAERWRYHRAVQGNAGAWQATYEQFIDPETGKLTRVFYQPATGERRYVVEKSTSKTG